MVMINRSAFAALKGILCHFPGERGKIHCGKKCAKGKGRKGRWWREMYKKKEMWEEDTV